MQYKRTIPEKKRRMVGTAQGRQTLISLLGCAILGMILSRVLPSVVAKLRPTLTPDAAEEVGVLIALGISALVLVVSLLRPKEHLSPMRRQLLKEQEKSDGS